VLGAGPGGYTAAFRGRRPGLRRRAGRALPKLGGVCLNVGCIPSKALLHAAEVITRRARGAYGVSFGEREDRPRQAARAQEQSGRPVHRAGRHGEAAQGAHVYRTGRFVSANELEIDADGAVKRIRFANAIIAAGSQPVKLPGFPWDDPRVMDSTDALMLHDIPKKLLVVGGGIIGLEMACVYAALGSAVTVVEFMPQLMPGCDPDLVKPLAELLKKRGVAVHLATKVAKGRGDEGRAGSRRSKATRRRRKPNTIARWCPSAAARTAARSARRRPA
jgi:dihydrolipoamide dehydrogenase